MKLLLLFLSLSLFAQNPSGPELQARRSIGVLLLAHGGSAKWNQYVTEVKKAVEKEGYPSEVALGMADVRSMNSAVSKLESKRVREIICVALFINSNSELYDQFAYVTGKRDKPSEELIGAFRMLKMSEKEQMKKSGSHSHASHHSHSMNADSKRLETKIPLRLTRGLDDHAYVSRILLARAQKISTQPSKETVLLISHGPYTDEAEKRWMDVSNKVAAELQQLGGFNEVKAFNLRDDSPKEIKEAKAKEIRQYAQVRSRQGKQLLVLPHLMAMNGIESHIRKALDGVFYKMGKEALLPHPLVARWVVEQVQGTQKK